MVVAFMIGGNVGTETLTPEQSGVGDSGRAAEISSQAYPQAVGESVLVQSARLQTGDREYRAVVTDVIDASTGSTASPRSTMTRRTPPAGRSVRRTIQRR